MSSISLNISNRPRNFKKIFSLERWGITLLSVQSLTLLWDIYTHVCIYIILGAFVYVCVCVCIYIYIKYWGASLVAQLVAQSVTQETPIWFLGQEDTLQKG